MTKSNYVIRPKQTHYDSLEIDEFWTYVGEKKNKVWLVYAYHRATGEIVAFVWGNRNYKTATKLRDNLSSLGVNSDTVYTDNWECFKRAFSGDNHVRRKENTGGIEGNNSRLRHRLRRAFRKTCCFYKKLFNHLSGKIIPNAYADLFEQLEMENNPKPNRRKGEKREFSPAEQDVFDAGRELWAYYHS